MGGSLEESELVRRHQGIAHRTAFLITWEAAEADDATQQAFVKAYGALGRFDPDRSFRAWLLRIVANEARNLRRSGGRRAALELAVAPGTVKSRLSRALARLRAVVVQPEVAGE